MNWLGNITDSTDLSLSKFWEIVWGIRAWCAAVHGAAKNCGSAGKESACDARVLGLSLGLGRSSGEGKDDPFQYSGQNSMDCCPWGRKESDTTEWLSLSLQLVNEQQQQQPYPSDSFISAVPDWFLYYIYTYTTSLVAQTVKSVYNAGDLGSIPGLGRSPGEGNGNPLQD